MSVKMEKSIMLKNKPDTLLPVIAIPLGDAAGIGPELVAKMAAVGFLETDRKSVV